MALRAEDVQVIGSELAVRWSDGGETYIPLKDLREKCPCAACCGEPDVTGRVLKPSVTFGPKSFDLLSLTPIGGYALQPLWGDGHRSGLYSYDYLRSLDHHPGETSA